MSNVAPKLDVYFKDYALYHQTRGNQLTHIFGIPMIMIAIFGWAAGWVWIRSTATELPGSLIQFDFAYIIMIAAVAWYLSLDWRMALPFIPVVLALYWLGRSSSNGVLWGLFIGGWVLQFIGHGIYEKKAPAFTKNIQHIFIGPLWVFAKLIR